MAHNESSQCSLHILSPLPPSACITSSRTALLYFYSLTYMGRVTVTTMLRPLGLGRRQLDNNINIVLGKKKQGVNKEARLN
jgi:hypothetical protein